MVSNLEIAHWLDRWAGSAEGVIPEAMILDLRRAAVRLREDASRANLKAWLVEHGPTDRPVYLRMRCPGPGWTKDPTKAVCFARQQDGQEALDHYGPDYGRVVEYTFPIDPS
jgi:hypothetical protein